jgi:hypothetical protein
MTILQKRKTAPVLTQHSSGSLAIESDFRIEKHFVITINIRLCLNNLLFDISQHYLSRLWRVMTMQRVIYFSGRVQK